MNSSFVRTVRSSRVALVAAVAVLAALLLIAPASASATAVAAPQVSGGLDPNTTETVTGMMPATSLDIPDPVNRGAAGAEGMRSASLAPSLQVTVPIDMQGIDVASHQHPNGAPIDWVAVRNSGVSFAFVKATESTGYTNPYYASDVAQGRAAGLYIGAYHYALPQYDAAAQANYMANVMAQTAAQTGTSTNLPPVLDLEENGGLSPAQLVPWVDTFLRQLLARTGRVPIIYTGQGFWNSSMGGSTAFGAYYLWDANWTTSATPAAVPGWSRWTFWQYTNGTYNDPPLVPGIQALTDRNRFSGGPAELAQFANGATGRWVAAAGSMIMNGPVSAEQVNYYSGVIDRGAGNRTSAAQSFLFATASFTRQTQADYRLILHREADPAGAAFFVSLRGTGFSEEAVRIALASSDEFYAAAGSNPTGYVQLLYSSLLGRPVDPGGLAVWTQHLAQGSTRQQVAHDVIMSREGFSTEVAEVYLYVLHRAVDPGGLVSFSNMMVSGLQYEVLESFLYGSAEFQSRLVPAS